ncbi:hypothetical protein JCM10212_002002 [Sporobolomyces blumeae]
MSSLATHHAPSLVHGFSTSPAAPSNSSPSSPSFPHLQSLSLNGTGFHLNLRPGTSSGTISSPPLGVASQGSGSTSTPPPYVDSSGLDYASLASWSDQHVAAWLSHSLPNLPTSYADVFAQNDIRGNVLLEVDQVALKEMGVRSVGDRVKICVAVRQLRGKYLAATGAATGPGGAAKRTSVLLSRFTASRPTSPLVSGSITLSPPASILSTPPGSATLSTPPSSSSNHAASSQQLSTSTSFLVDPRPGSGSYSARNISVGNRIPPPLHLAQSNVTPKLQHAHPPQVHHAQAQTVSPPSRTTSPRHAQFNASSSGARQVPPPSLPPPTSRIPLPPPASSNAPGSSREWSGENGTSPNSQLRPSTGTTRHKASNSSIATRPSTAQASLSSYSGHPYAASAQSQLLPSPLEHPSSTSSKSDSHHPSPLQQQQQHQGGYTVGRSTFARPSTAGGLVSSSGVIASSVSSTPLSNLDVMRKAVKFTSADGVTTRVLAVGDAKDGREVLSRVVRKFSTSGPSSGSGSGGLSMTGSSKDDDLDGWGVWTPDNNGLARLLSEQELHAICQNTSAPERARGLFVRRLPSSASAASSPLPTISTTAPSNGQNTPQPSSPLQTQSSSALAVANSTISPSKRGRKLQWVFGDSHAASADSTRPGGSVSFLPSAASLTGGSSTNGAGGLHGSPTSSPTSPNYLGIEIPKMGFEPPSPSTSAGSDFEDQDFGGIGGDDDESSRAVRVRNPSGPEKKSSNNSGKMNRASTVSVMSGLEAPDWARDYYGRSSEDGGSSSTGSTGGGGSTGPYMASPPQRTSSRRNSPPTSHDSMIHPSAAPARRSTTEPHPRSSSPTASISSSLAPSSARKLRNFFGQRPPSELIATHLTEFFPLGLRGSGDKKLSKQVRSSIRKSMGAHALGGGSGRRMSTTSVASSTRATIGGGGGGPLLPPPHHHAQTSWEKKEESSAMSRFSGSSDGSGGLSHASQATTRGPGGGRSPRSSSSSALDPPDESAEDQDPNSLVIVGGEGGTLVPSPESSSMALNLSSSSSRSASVHNDDLADTRSIASSLAPSYLDSRSARLSTRRMSRMSGSSRLSVGAQSLWERRSKDSDAASVITVDDVTADLETRRASRASWSGLQSDEDESVIGSDEEEESDEEESETEASEDEADGPEGAPAKTEAKGMKWIKGALIGAGSFGSVYLGMNPLTGSLMAVKQVELPTGKSHNEERKKSMLEALEREIELLKVLQHENIVQYLDSSTDAQHLNIFLEYVPGGSVAALLSNYGAFEEALVSKFVRQILTGLEYLHEREIIHRDIKGANILVDNKGNIKISDFGISKKVEDNLLSGAKVHRPSLQGSVYWMAPEVVKQTAYTSKADIWSLGCLVVEMLTGAHPWANLTQMQAIFRIGSSGRPTVPDDISGEADDFLEQTFEIEHTARPSAKELLAHPFIREDGNLQTPTRETFRQDSGSS